MSAPSRPAVRAEPASGFAPVAPDEALSWLLGRRKPEFVTASAEEWIRRAAIFAENAAFVAKHNGARARRAGEQMARPEPPGGSDEKEMGKMLGLAVQDASGRFPIVAARSRATAW